jgi:hypothetical protein
MVEGLRPSSDLSNSLITSIGSLSPLSFLLARTHTPLELSAKSRDELISRYGDAGALADTPDQPAAGSA